jgi:hypothetical protein
VQWSADFHDEFVAEYSALSEKVQDEVQAIIEVLEQPGPQLGRPRVDTLNGSAHANMKERSGSRPRMGSGASRLRSIRTARRSFSAAATNRA